jgi:hypothetical protein
MQTKKTGVVHERHETRLLSDLQRVQGQTLEASVVLTIVTILFPTFGLDRQGNGSTLLGRHTDTLCAGCHLVVAVMMATMIRLLILIPQLRLPLFAAVSERPEVIIFEFP